MSRMMRSKVATAATLRQLLKAQPPPPPTPPPAVQIRYSSFIDAFIVTPDDLRSPLNNRPHTPTPHTGAPPKTPAAAAKIRRGQMLLCGCRLCELALRPPTTFAEAEALGLHQPSLNDVEAVLEPLRAEAAERAKREIEERTARLVRGAKEAA